MNEGAKVVITGHSEENGAEIAKRLGENVVFKRTDVTNEEEIKTLIDFTLDRFGALDCMFNNAGGPDRGTIETVTSEDFIYAMKLLVGSVVFGMKYAAPVMKARKSGCIINTSSVAAIRSGQGGYLYSTAKASVTHITKLAGVQLGPFGIRVNCISPGAIATPIFFGGSKVAQTLDPAETREKWKNLSETLPRLHLCPEQGWAKISHMRLCSLPATRAASSIATTWLWTVGELRFSLRSREKRRAHHKDFDRIEKSPIRDCEARSGKLFASCSTFPGTAWNSAKGPHSSAIRRLPEKHIAADIADGFRPHQEIHQQEHYFKRCSRTTA